MTKILLVDDDSDLSSMVAQSLALELYAVETASDGESGFFMLKTNSYDLAIVDWDMPKITGTELCKKYRSQDGKIPILMLTGKAAVSQRVEGLESGADDYLVKPFSVDELVARVKALLRRAHLQGSSNNLVYKNVCLEPNNYRVTKDGQEIKLIPKEFSILELLIRYKGKVFSPGAIIDRVWENNEYPATDVIRTHIMNLRRKIGDSIIDTVHGVGYRVPLDK